jgi:hypothetical protein
MDWKIVEDSEVPDSITGATNKNDARISRTAQNFVMALSPLRRERLRPWTLPMRVPALSNENGLIGRATMRPDECWP